MATGSDSRGLDQYRPTLIRYFSARGAGQEAEDMVQELWLKLDSVDLTAIENLSAYLFRMAHNLMLDRIRDAKRRREREKSFHGALHGDNPQEAATAERALIAREHLGEVDRALLALGPKTNMIFRRHRLEGVTQVQIARELGLTVSAIEKHLQKAYRTVADLQRRYALEQSDVSVPRGPRHGND